MIEILEDIPFEIGLSGLLERVHIEPDSEDAEEIDALLERVHQVAKPKAAYRLCFIDERVGDAATIEGVRFYSRATV